MGAKSVVFMPSERRQAMKKPTREKAHFKTFPIKMSLGKVYFCFCLCVLTYALSTPILTVILKHHGNRCKGTITANESSLVHRWTSNNYLYEFSLGNKTYTGNSLIKVGNNDKIGDTITVLYFEFFPSFNRPVTFYEDK